MARGVTRTGIRHRAPAGCGARHQFHVTVRHRLNVGTSALEQGRRGPRGNIRVHFVPTSATRRPVPSPGRSPGCCMAGRMTVTASSTSLACARRDAASPAWVRRHHVFSPRTANIIAARAGTCSPSPPIAARLATSGTVTTATSASGRPLRRAGSSITSSRSHDARGRRQRCTPSGSECRPLANSPARKHTAPSPAVTRTTCRGKRREHRGRDRMTWKHSRHLRRGAHSVRVTPPTTAGLNRLRSGPPNTRRPGRGFSRIWLVSERILGRRNSQALRGHHPGKPAGFEIRRLIGSGNVPGARNGSSSPHRP